MWHKDFWTKFADLLFIPKNRLIHVVDKSTNYLSIKKSLWDSSVSNESTVKHYIDTCRRYFKIK